MAPIRLDKISLVMRDVLIEHIDGVGVPIVLRSLPHQKRTIRALVRRGWIRCEPGPRPHHTFITEAGRAALAAVLADYAEAILRAESQEEARISASEPMLPGHTPIDIPAI